jgi:hypothetical protein
MNKKGGSQVDWAISLGIFLIYLAWFFIFVRPIGSMESPLGSTLDMVELEVNDKILWTVYQTPVFVTANYSGLAPLIVNGKVELSDYNGMAGKELIEDQGHLFYMTTLNGNVIDYVVSSSENYTERWNTTFLLGEDSVSSDAMTVLFNNGRIDNVSYQENKRIKDFDIYVGYDLIEETYSAYTGYNFMSKHFMTYFVNHSTYIFDGLPWIYGLVQGNGSVKLRFNLDDYDNYYITETYSGDVPVNGSDCLTFDYNYIEFSDLTDRILFVVDNGDVNISLCGGISDFNLDLDVDFNDQFWYRIIFLKDYYNYSDYLNLYSASLGYPIEVEGLNEDLVENLTNMTYSEAKSYLTLGNYDFSLEVDTLNVDSTLNANPDFLGSIKSKSVERYVIDKFANTEDVTVHYVTW